jgi:hypothetical protein
MTLRGGEQESLTEPLPGVDENVVRGVTFQGTILEGFTQPTQRGKLMELKLTDAFCFK